MRFSDNGYYIERYVKCDNCGVLIYDGGLVQEHARHGTLVLCSSWCREWKMQKLEGIEIPAVPFDFAG